MSKKKLTKKRKKQLLTMFALTGVTISNFSSPVMALANTVDESKTEVSASSTDTIANLNDSSILDSAVATDSSENHTADTTSKEETPATSSEEVNQSTKDTTTPKDSTNESVAKVEKDKTTSTTDTDGAKEATVSNVQSNFEDGTLTIDHVNTDKLSGELGAAIGEGVGVNDVQKLVVSGSAALGDLDWGKLGQLTAVFPNVTALDIETADTTIPALTFSGASWLTEITMPNITTVGESAFSGVTGLTKVNLGITDTTQLATMFKDSADTITDFTLNNVTETPDVKSDAGFISFTALKNVQMDNVVRVGAYTFHNVTTLSNIVAPKLEEVRVSAFYGTHLTDINNLKNLKIIGEWAFGFVPLEKIDLPNVTSVAAAAFSAYNGTTSFEATITEVNLPNATDTDRNAFQGQNKIQKVNLGITDTTQLGTMFKDSAGTITDFTLNNVTETPDLSDEETDAKGFGIFSVLKNVQMDNIVRVGANTFTKYNATLEHVSMPKVEEIGEWAFGCSTGGSVILDLSGLKNVKKIGEGAFEHLNTSNPDFPNVTSVGAEAFKQYQNAGIITEINMPNATDVDNSAFAQQPKIEKVNLGITDTTKLATMFGSSAGTITDFTLNNVTETPDVRNEEYKKGFASFDALKNVQMDNITKIGAYTFSDIDTLSNIVAPKLEEVEQSGFSATHLTDLSNLKNLKIIGDAAFYHNYLEKIDLPNVTSIGSYAFASSGDGVENVHPTITEVNLPNATDTNPDAFRGQNKIQKVNLGITDTTQLATMFGSSAGTITDFTLNNVTATPDLESASDEEDKGFSSFTALKNLNMPKLEEVGDYTFGHSSVVPATLFDHKNENGDKIPGTITSAGYQAFESMTNLPVVEMSNIASLNKTAFKNADTKAIIIPQDNLPQKQVESFFNSNKAILGIVYGEGEIDVPAKLGSDVKLGSEEGIKYLYNSETAGVPVTYQWSKDGKVLDTELSSEKEIAHFAAEDAGKYEKSVQLTLKDGEENDKNSELYHVGTYVLHEEAQAPTDPVMDADTLVDTSVAISGKTVAGAQVRLTDKDGKLTYNLATADETGKFTFSLAAPYEAGTKLYVQATNEVGSSAIVEADIVAGAQKPVANVPTKGDKVITGTGKAGNTITITNGIDTLGTGTVAEDGTFSVELGTPVTVGQKFKVYATTVPVDETHPLDENLMVTVTAVDSVGTITVDDYHTGDRTITGSYTGNIDSIRLVIGGETISRGGTVKDGKFSYYCGDKIKAEQTVTLEGLDKNNQVLDSKEFKAINTSEGTLTDAHYKLGSNEITAAYTGDVAKICLRVNGEVVSWGGTLSEGHVSYYVKSNAIKANDKVTVQAYDQYSAPLGEEQVVQFEKSEGSLKTAVREAGSNVIKGTYEGDAAGAVLKVNGEIVSQGGSFANGTFSYYIGAMKFKEDDVITMEGLDEQQQALDSDPVTVEIQKGEATVSDLSYTLGATLITGTYEGVPVKAQLLVDGTSVSYGGTFKDGTLSYVVKADTITSKDQKVTMNIFDIDGNTVQKDLPVTVTADQK